MSLSEIIIKLIGLVLAIVGFGLILAAVGVSILGLILSPWWLSILVGLLFLALGIYLVRGGGIKL